VRLKHRRRVGRDAPGRDAHRGRDLLHEKLDQFGNVLPTLGEQPSRNGARGSPR